MNNDFWKNKRVLVTGGSGFVGSAVSSYLRANDVFVLQTKRKRINESEGVFNNYLVIDLKDSNNICSYCRDYDINYIIHCAGLDGNYEYKQNNQREISETNILIARNLIESVKDINDVKVCLISSAEVYNDLSVDVADEDVVLPFVKADKNIPYHQMKIVVERLFSDGLKSDDQRLYIARPVSIYGPGDYFRANQRIVSVFIKKAMDNEDIVLWNRNSKKYFIYIDDFVYALIAFMENPKYNIINIGCEEFVSIEKLAKLVVNKINSESDIIINESAAKVKFKECNISFSKIYIITEKTPRLIADGVDDLIKKIQQ